MMKYTLIHTTESLEPYYMGPGKADPTQTFRSEVNDTYCISSDDEFDRLVNDITDAPDYKLTDENFDKWWGSDPKGKVSEDAKKRIFRYYNERKDMKERILADVTSFRNSSDKTFSRAYDLPESSTWFSTKEKDEYSPMLSRESIWITAERT